MKTKKRTAYSLMKSAERLHKEAERLSQAATRLSNQGAGGGRPSTFASNAAALFEEAAYKLVQASDVLEKEVVRRRLIKKEAERQLAEGAHGEGP